MFFTQCELFEPGSPARYFFNFNIIFMEMYFFEGPNLGHYTMFDKDGTMERKREVEKSPVPGRIQTHDHTITDLFDSL